jgi:hypothetical protein
VLYRSWFQVHKHAPTFVLYDRRRFSRGRRNDDLGCRPAPHGTAPAAAHQDRGCILGGREHASGALCGRARAALYHLRSQRLAARRRRADVRHNARAKSAPADCGRAQGRRLRPERLGVARPELYTGYVGSLATRFLGSDRGHAGWPPIHRARSTLSRVGGSKTGVWPGGKMSGTVRGCSSRCLATPDSDCPPNLSIDMQKRDILIVGMSRFCWRHLDSAVLADYSSNNQCGCQSEGHPFV